jgi:hypothetical protein
LIQWLVEFAWRTSCAIEGSLIKWNGWSAHGPRTASACLLIAAEGVEPGPATEDALLDVLLAEFVLSLRDGMDPRVEVLVTDILITLSWVLSSLMELNRKTNRILFSKVASLDVADI